MSDARRDKSNNGLFEAYINARAYRATAEDRALIAALNEVVGAVVPASQVRWAGSQRKGTAIAGSDLDVVVESRDPVTEAQRRTLRSQLEGQLARPARVLSHAVRLPEHQGAPKVDVAFANAAFGSRPLPDIAEYHNRPNRQAAARALKLWTRAGNLPFIAGWAVEALVVHLDSPPQNLPPLPLFVRVVGWATSRHIDRHLVLDALRMALGTRRPPAGLIHHTDRGSQYASHDYRQALEDAGIVCSMSRKGDCWDNAPAESFFATIKVEELRHHDFATREQARDAILQYLCWYNAHRRHSTLGLVSPAYFETHHTHLPIAA